MNAKELDKLLEKYYSGESTEAEEIILKDYFNGDNILSGYETEREIFLFYHTEGEIPEPSADFEIRIMEGIDNFGKKEKSYFFRRYMFPLIGAAASILIVAGTYLVLNQKTGMMDSFTDPQIAYQETRKILFDVSAKMNRATLALEPVGKMSEMTSRSFSAINKSTGIIEKNIRSLEVLTQEKTPSDGTLQQSQ